MSHSWLARQRKQTLLDLSTEAGLPQDDDLRKDEIIDNLDAHLQKNATNLAGKAAFEDYFGKRRSTPGRPPRDSATSGPSGEEGDVKSVVKKAGKRSTKVKQETDKEDNFLSSPLAATASSAKSALVAVSSALSPSAQLTTRTPAQPRRRSELPGPPSPADVADLAEYESTRFVEGVNTLYRSSGITENIEYLRDMCSSVTAVQISFLLLEAFALQRHLMPWRFAFDIPSTPLSSSIAVFYPDLFILVTGYYWSATLLWFATSIFVPVLFAYFYNLTLREVKRGTTRVSVVRYTADPLMYNIVKALATWLVYARGVSFGFISAEVADRVDMSIYGGSTAVLIGSGIGALATIYDAAQKKHL